MYKHLYKKYKCKYLLFKSCKQMYNNIISDISTVELIDDILTIKYNNDKIKKYSQFEVIGKGSYGTVYVYKNIDDLNDHLAVKFPVSTSGDFSNLMNDINKIKEIEQSGIDENIVKTFITEITKPNNSTKTKTLSPKLTSLSPRQRTKPLSPRQQTKPLSSRLNKTMSSELSSNSSSESWIRFMDELDGRVTPNKLNIIIMNRETSDLDYFINNIQIHHNINNYIIMCLLLINKIIEINIYLGKFGKGVSDLKSNNFSISCEPFDPSKNSLEYLINIIDTIKICDIGSVSNYGDIICQRAEITHVGVNYINDISYDLHSKIYKHINNNLFVVNINCPFSESDIVFYIGLLFYKILNKIIVSEPEDLNLYTEFVGNNLLSKFNTRQKFIFGEIIENGSQPIFNSLKINKIRNVSKSVSFDLTPVRYMTAPDNIRYSDEYKNDSLYKIIEELHTQCFDINDVTDIDLMNFLSPSLSDTRLFNLDFSKRLNLISLKLYIDNLLSDNSKYSPTKYCIL